MRLLRSDIAKHKQLSSCSYEISEKEKGKVIICLTGNGKFNIINSHSNTKEILSIVNFDTDQKLTSLTRKDSSNKGEYYAF